MKVKTEQALHKQKKNFKNILEVLLKKKKRDFPSGTVVKNPPANVGDRFDPWSKKIPHAVEQLVRHNY